MDRDEGTLVAGMKVLMVEAGKHPYELEIGHTPEATYKVLDCDTIIATYPWITLWH